MLGDAVLTLAVSLGSPCLLVQLCIQKARTTRRGAFCLSDSDVGDFIFLVLLFPPLVPASVYLRLARWAPSQEEESNNTVTWGGR